MKRGRITLVTGPAGSGKTTFCTQVVAATRGASVREISLGGILSPGEYKDGRKTAIEAVDVRGGDRRTLAVPNKGGPQHLCTKRWCFQPLTIDWCNRVFQKAVPCDLLIVDELGPLELERGQGFTQSFPAIDGGEYQLALVCVRPRLLCKATVRWRRARALELVDLEDPRQAREEILSSLTTSD